MENQTNSIKDELTEALKSEELDINLIIGLTNKLAQSDPNLVRFSTDAGIINRLGRELVAKQETAVAELIKNAYDADAVNVTLTFDNAHSPGGTLTIEDDGIGMTREQLVNGFMRLSSADKIDNPVSTIFSRKRAGRKGIGRFAVQRLGSFLKIITQTAENNSSLIIEIDWNSFVSGKELMTIGNKIRETSKVREAGTTLLIEGLLEGWSDSEIRRAYRYILDLLQPFPLTFGGSIQHNQNTMEISDPGFHVKMERSQNGKVKSIADEQQSIYQHAIAEIEAYVDNEGKGTFTVKSERFDINESIAYDLTTSNAEKNFTYLRDVKVKAYYFIWQPDLYSRAIFHSLRELSQEKAGIRIYRNGFRVRPYGERKDDWLGLDASTANRDILPPHANINFWGFAELHDDEGIFFDETSSREGLIENAAFRELQDFCSNVLKNSTLRIAQIRGRKQTKNQRDWEQVKGKPIDVIKNAATSLKSAAEDELKKINDLTHISKLQGHMKNESPANKQSLFPDGSFFERATELAEEILEANNILTEREEIFLQELGMLRVLASLGLTIGEFTHEVRQTLDAATLDAQNLSKSLSSDDSLHRKAVRLTSNIKRFTTYAAYFDKVVQDNASRELFPQDLRMIVVAFVNLIDRRSKEFDIRITQNIVGQNLITPPMHSSELASILFNLYSNSQKAIRRANVEGHIHINVSINDSNLIIEFMDNGDGIPGDKHAHIFDAFYTTSTRSGNNPSDMDDIQGTGLGLKIVKDIVESYKGKVFVANHPDFSTCIRIELPPYKEKSNV